MVDKRMLLVVWSHRRPESLVSFAHVVSETINVTGNTSSCASEWYAHTLKVPWVSGRVLFKQNARKKNSSAPTPIVNFGGVSTNCRIHLFLFLERYESTYIAVSKL